MIIPQINTANYGGFLTNCAFLSRQDALKVIKDVVPKVSTFATPEDTCENDMEVIKKIILPAFFKLYQMCPDAYNILMKRELRIAIIKFKHDDLFYIERTKTRTPAAVLADRSAVCLNMHDKFTTAYLIDSLYHELMHFAGIRATGGGRLGEVLDKKLGGKLTRISNNYMTRLKRAINTLKIYHKEKYKNAGDFYAYYGGVMRNEKCWVQTRAPRADMSISAEYCKFRILQPDNAEEILAWGLEFYYHSKEDRELLRKQEPELYKIIEQEAVPMFKKAAKK